jgi:signal transduction histidine kinase
MSDSAEKNPGLDRSSVRNKGVSSDSANSDVQPLLSLPPSRPRRHISVVLKLTLLVGLTLGLLLAVLLTASGWYWRRVLHSQVDAQLSAVAASRRDMVQAQILLLRQRVALNTDRGEVRGFFYELANNQLSAGNREGSRVTLERMSDGRPVVAASLVNSAGKVVLSTESTEVGQDLSAEPEFHAGLVGPHIGQPRWVHGRFEAILTAPVFTRAEPRRTYGVLRLVADVSDLAGALRDVTGLGETGEAVLGVRSGNEFQFLFPPRNAPEKTVVSLSGAPAIKAATEGGAVLTKNLDYRGIPVLAVGRPVGYNGWTLIVKMDEDEAYAPILHARRFGILLGLLVAAAGLATAFALALSFTRPVRRLAQAAARVTSGDYETAVPVHSSDEFGTLSASFNEMTAAIHTRRQERDRAETALRETDQRKDEVLAMLGHELRNPLAAIAHAVRLEQDATEDPDVVDMARRVVARQTANLSRLVDDLLDVARITQGKIKLRRQFVDLSQIVDRAVDAVRPLIVERGHQLDLLLSSGAQWRVDGDEMRIEQVVTNLLTNAAKYTPDGGRITIVERLDGRDAVITIADNGIGISPEILPRVFELFTQADHSLDRTSGGLGLGLNLCRQVVELHGGTISAHSNGVGKGSAFTVRLPAVDAPEPAEPAPAQLPPQPANKHPRRRILLVDDNQDTVHSLSRLLTRRGHEVATAFDGLAALQVAQEFKPDVLLLDLGLPDLDGYELARRLRASGFAHAPIIAISGYAQESDRARSRAAGFNYHFAKPVDFEALAELIIEEPLSID